MWAAVAAILGALKVFFGFFSRGKVATAVDLADSNARTQEQLAQRDDENAAIVDSANARADADARMLRTFAGNSGPSASNPAINEQIRKQFPDEFAD